MQNRKLQKSITELEEMVHDVNCMNTKLRAENKSLKERLAKKTKCDCVVCHVQPEIPALSQQLVSFH
jgi:regulator of replication initiation timing